MASPIMIDLHAVYTCCQRFRCAIQRCKRFVVPSVGGTTRFTNLRQKFSKMQKKLAAVLCQILRMITVYIVTNCSSVQQRMHVTISCRYCIAFEVMLLFLVLTLLLIQAISLRNLFIVNVDDVVQQCRHCYHFVTMCWYVKTNTSDWNDLKLRTIVVLKTMSKFIDFGFKVRIRVRVMTQEELALICIFKECTFLLI